MMVSEEHLRPDSPNVRIWLTISGEIVLGREREIVVPMPGSFLGGK